MRSPDRRFLDEICRSDLMAFIQRAFHTVAPGQSFAPNWHIEAIAYALDRCLSGEVKRLLITMPPRHLKSICASVTFPAYLLGHDPTTRIITASYSGELAAKHASDCRRVMETAWYKRVFPGVRLSRTKNQELNFLTNRQGYRYSTSVGGTLTGRGGNFIIVDDPLKPEDALSAVRRRAVNDWFDGTLYSRLDDKREDVIIVIMQRLHVEDLAAHILAKQRWVHLNLPALSEVAERVQIGPSAFYDRETDEPLHPEREPREVLEHIKHSIGSYNFSSQYQQQPIPPQGEIIKWSWFRRYDSPLRREAGDMVVQSWDTASKGEELSDYSVGTTWLARGDDHYLLDVTREKLNYPDLRRRIGEKAEEYRPKAIVIEDKGSGTSLLADLGRSRPSGVPRPIGYQPKGDKLTRMAAHSALIEAGHMFLPTKASWLDAFHQEMLLFPYGSYDDQVDSVSQYIGWIEDRRSCRSSIRRLAL